MTRNEDDDEESTWKRPNVTTDGTTDTAGDREFMARDSIEMESNRPYLVPRKISRSESRDPAGVHRLALVWRFAKLSDSQKIELSIATR